MEEIHESRRSLYLLLSRIFYQEPDLELLKQLKANGLVDEMKISGFDLGLSESEFSEALTEELVLEYTRLFIGPGGHVSLYASVHSKKTGDGGRMWGDSTVEIKKYIEATGLEFSSKYEGIPDHLSIELEFLAHLVTAQQKAEEKDDPETVKSLMSIEKKFIDHYLLDWFPSFVEALEDRNPLPFYRSFVLFTRDWLQLELYYLESPA